MPPRGSMLPCLALRQRSQCCQRWLQTGKMGGGREMMENTEGGNGCARKVVRGLEYMRARVGEHDLCALAPYQGGKTLRTMGCLLTVGRKWGRTGQERQQLFSGRPRTSVRGQKDQLCIPTPTPGSLEQDLFPRVDHHCSTE